MIHVTGVLAIAVSCIGQVETGPGSVRGTVINASQSDVRSSGTEVILRAGRNGHLIPIARTTTDQAGQFEITGLPVDEDLVYLPGANRDGIHYPGIRFRLSAERPSATVDLKVHDSMQAPSPLVIRRQEVLIETQPGALRVTESLVIDNPTQMTYVGKSTGEAEEPVTLELGIPMDFDRTTFSEEFYARRFSIVGERLITAIPWTPGERELRFRYTIPNDQPYRVWQRSLDLPCEHLQVRVRHNLPEEVTCNLPASSVKAEDERIFEIAGPVQPAGKIIEVELGQLARPWMDHARWFALATLATLIVGSCAFAIPRQRRARQSMQTANVPTDRVPEPHRSSGRHRGRRRDRQPSRRGR